MTYINTIDTNLHLWHKYSHEHEFKRNNTMIYLTKRALIIGAFLLSSAFAAPSNPSTWNVHPTDPTKIQIRDDNKRVIATQRLIGNTSGRKVLTIKGQLCIVKEITFSELQQAQTRPLATTSASTTSVSTRRKSGSGSTTTRLTGQKRGRSETQPPKSAPPTKKRKSKYDGIDFSKIVCWRVNPTNTAFFQLLGADNKVIFSDTITIHTRKRKLKSGYLCIKDHHLQRHPDDNVNLIRSGFDIIEGEQIRVLNQVRPSLYRDIDMTKVRSWRISPNKPGHIDLLDHKDMILISIPVLTHQGRRKVTNGQILLHNQKTNRGFFTPRHPADKTKLSDNDFYFEDRIAPASKFDDVNLKTGKCWRIHPNKPGFLQILDKHKNVIYTGPVLTHQGRRHTKYGKLALRNDTGNDKIYYNFPRDPSDTEDLTANGFAPGQTFHYLADEDLSHDSNSDEEGEMEFQRTTTTSLISNLHLMPESNDEDESDEEEMLDEAYLDNDGGYTVPMD